MNPGYQTKLSGKLAIHIRPDVNQSFKSSFF